MAIEINELRVGNLIYNNKQECYVMSVFENNKVELGYFKDSIGFIRSLDVGIKPIPIIEEYLLNFGFKKDETEFRCRYYKGCFEYYIPKIPEYKYKGLFVKGYALPHE